MFDRWNDAGMALVEEYAEPNARTLWVSDGVVGYARQLRPGETVQEALADFAVDGEPADRWELYEGGEWTETGRPSRW